MTTPLFRRPLRREAVALLALLAFGCTVVRAPASAIAPRVPVRAGAAEPQLELWLESGGPVAPPEAAAAAAEGKAVLEQALAPRRLEEGDQLLVVRAQGVSRTESRRSNQTAAIAGMVIGVVVVAVAAIAASKGGGGHRGAPAATGSTPRVTPRTGPVAPVPPRPPGTRAVPIPSGQRYGHVHGGVGVEVGVVVPIFPGPPLPPPEASAGAWHGAPPPPPGSVPPPPPPPPGVEAVPVEPGAPLAAPAEAQLAELSLPALPPFDLESRGFFSGDAVRVELLLLDRQTGAPLWVKVVEAGVDPRDGEKMKGLLDQALDDPGGWSPAGT